MREISSFCVVTEDNNTRVRSLWLVKNERLPKNKLPFIQRIGGLELDSTGVRLGGFLSGNRRLTKKSDQTVIGLTGKGLVIYLDADEANPPVNGFLHQRPDGVRSGFLIDSTPPIVGIFFNQKMARKCLVSGGLSPDEGWQECTRKVLFEIGSNHPMFVPADREFDRSKDPEFSKLLY